MLAASVTISVVEVSDIIHQYYNYFNKKVLNRVIYSYANNYFIVFIVFLDLWVVNFFLSVINEYNEVKTLIYIITLKTYTRGHSV